MQSQSREVPSQSKSPEGPGCLGILARIIWAVLGNVALLFIAVKVVQSRGFSLFDAVYWLVLVALIVIRYVDIRYLKGQGADDQPATMRDWRRHALLLLTIAGGVWVVVHVALLLLTR